MGILKKKKSDVGSDGLVKVEIREHKDSKGGHPHIITHESKGRYASVGLTRQPKRGNTKKAGRNKKLDTPVGEAKESYMRRGGIVASKTEYGKPSKVKMTQGNHKLANYYGQKQLINTMLTKLVKIKKSNEVGQPFKVSILSRIVTSQIASLVL